MKAAVLHDRAARGDFIDVQGIAGLPAWSVGPFIEYGARRLPLGAEQVARGMTYFVDSKKDPMPRGCKVSWVNAKADLIKGAPEWNGRRTAESPADFPIVPDARIRNR